MTKEVFYGLVIVFMITIIGLLIGLVVEVDKVYCEMDSCVISVLNER